MLLQYVQYAMDRLGLAVRDEEEGQGLVEYALIIVLISIAAIISMRALGTSIIGVFDEITGELSS